MNSKRNAFCCRSFWSGFTLAELLMAVLVISIIMVALAPVITRRVTDNIKINVFKHDGQLFLYGLHDPNCIPAEDGQLSVDCEFKPPSGVKSVNVIMVSGGGGGAGATAPIWRYNLKNTASTTVQGDGTTKEFVIKDNMKNIMISYMTGGGGGGGSGAYKSSEGIPQSQSGCPANTKFVKNHNGQNVCVTKYNVGDPGGPPLPAGVTVAIAGPSGTSCTPSATTFCCWSGETSPTYACENSYTNGDLVSTYSGCIRTVCDWRAANAACLAYTPSTGAIGSWRLPTKDEMKDGWASATKYLGSTGLQLCDGYSSYGSAQCQNFPGACSGAHHGYCYPRYIWSSRAGSGDYYTRYLDKGTFDENWYDPDYAFSARCVLERSNVQLYSPFGGGGGGSAPYIKNYTVPENIIADCIGGKIVMHAGKGGKGAKAPDSPNVVSPEPTASEGSYVRIYDKKGILKWGVTVNAGAMAGVTDPGRMGVDGKPGEGGAAVDICAIFDGSSWSKLGCNSGRPGDNGSANTMFTSDTVVAGDGGGSFYNTTSESGGGIGARGSLETGGRASIWGAGGGGGIARVLQNPDGTYYVVNGDGGDGANGIVEVTYGEILQAAGGGGGGAGGYVQFENIDIEPTKTYTIRVGGAGIGGGESMQGTHGGETVIDFGTKYVVPGGFGGSVGTPQTETAPVRHGAGGLGSFIPDSIADKAYFYAYGKNGTSGQDIKDSTGKITGSSGGTGGTSGIGTLGACGGLFQDDICSNSNVNASTLNFMSPGNIFEIKEYGKAGAGGGGGGWKTDSSNPGGGSGGLDGYVYIYWNKPD